ncbi:single-stranded DNA-binding protein [Sedimentibacter sp. zth1]|jgi:single-strand DNA-binding protein|uniref:single-stranded DNA-binding protein n=1 Tax=Sedimentibacter sp. zth1 TaxID=2816908 RepID=UPI001A921DA8|nr:single-stranded DNA-binding protein [Sedimentibacter sp. zth1]QSX05009.1 single-stranded DNA-binding protein [Sedimentibacter sp. zth1]
MNSVVLIGRLTRDPDLKFTPSGMAFTRMTLAVDKELFGDKKQEAINQGKPTADFISISVFGKQAENCANYLAKGSMCAVNGRISTGSYTTQSGEKKYTTDVIANRVEFIGSKQSASTLPGKPKNPDSNFFDDFSDDDNDIFQPVDEEDIPF